MISDRGDVELDSVLGIEIFGSAMAWFNWNLRAVERSLGIE